MGNREITAIGFPGGDVLCRYRADGDPCPVTNGDPVGYHGARPNPHMITDPAVAAAQPASGNQAIPANMRTMCDKALGVNFAVFSDKRFLPGENTGANGSLLEEFHMSFKNNLCRINNRDILILRIPGERETLAANGCAAVDDYIVPDCDPALDNGERLNGYPVSDNDVFRIYRRQRADPAVFSDSGWKRDPYIFRIG